MSFAYDPQMPVGEPTGATLVQAVELFDAISETRDNVAGVVSLLTMTLAMVIHGAVDLSGGTVPDMHRDIDNVANTMKSVVSDLRGGREH
jgi:hypothetical protein